MAEKTNEQKTGKALIGKRDILLIIGLLLAVLVGRVIFQFVYSTYHAHRIYEALTTFTPTEGSRIEIDYNIPGQLRVEQIVLEDVGEQEALMERLSGLGYGGLWLPAPLNNEDVIPNDEQTERSYDISLYPPEELPITWTVLGEQCYEILSPGYLFKYTNAGPALEYLDELFGVTAAG